MGFPAAVANTALFKSKRCCCICHRFCGTKIELHHIKQKTYGGEDTLENCIPLCFDCHADMGKADPNHPKGKRYSEEELKMFRDDWFEHSEVNLSNEVPSILYSEDYLSSERQSVILVRNEYERLRRQIAQSLVMYACCFGNPIDIAKTKDHRLPEHYQEGCKKLRELGAELIAFCETTDPKILALLFPGQDIMRAAKNLIALSNRFTTPYDKEDNDLDSQIRCDIETIIRKELKIEA